MSEKETHGDRQLTTVQTAQQQVAVQPKTAGPQQGMVAYPDQINLIELAYVLLRHSVSICLVAVLGAAAAFCYTNFFVAPTYQATSKLYVVSASKDSVINLNDLQLGSQLTGDFRELILGRTIMTESLTNLGLDWSTGRLASSLSITNPNGTRILRITATANDPELAADIANEVARQSMECLPRIMACETPRIAEIAVVPKNKSGPDFMKNTFTGGVAGALLMIAFYVLRYLMNDAIVTPDDVTHYLQLETLAVIPEDTVSDKNKAKRRKKD